jgi:hypothetical protein
MTTYTFVIEGGFAMPRLQPLDSSVPLIRDDGEAIAFARGLAEKFAGVPWFKHIHIWDEDRLIAEVRLSAPLAVVKLPPELRHANA